MLKHFLAFTLDLPYPGEVNKRFRTCDLDQPLLLPPSLQDWLPENHLGRFIADLTSSLDLSVIYARYGRRDGRGKAAYHPLMLVRLLLYGYCVGDVEVIHLGSCYQPRKSERREYAWLKPRP